MNGSGAARAILATWPDTPPGCAVRAVGLGVPTAEIIDDALSGRRRRRSRVEALQSILTGELEDDGVFRKVSTLGSRALEDLGWRCSPSSRPSCGARGARASSEPARRGAPG